MSRKATVFNLLIASPSDLDEERNAVVDAVRDWNATNGKKERVLIEAQGWESHSIPELGKRPQSILNTQLVEHADIVVAMLWTRLGTPTGRQLSGTVEEIRRAQKAGKQVLVYFSNKPVPRNSIDTNEVARLDRYKRQLKDIGLYHEFSGVDDLKSSLSRHLSGVIERLHWGNHIPEPLREYFKHYSNLATREDLSLRRVRTSSESFMAAVESILNSLGRGDSILATDAFKPSPALALYWATDGIEYLRMNFEAAKRGVKIRRALIARGEDIKRHKAYLKCLCELQAMSGVMPVVVRFEGLDKGLRREFAVFGKSLVDEVVYDYFAEDVVENYISWDPNIVSSFRRKGELIMSKKEMQFAVTTKRARTFQMITAAADTLQRKFGKSFQQNS